jgi:hypothetical protein
MRETSPISTSARVRSPPSADLIRTLHTVLPSPCRIVEQRSHEYYHRYAFGSS